VVADFAGQGHRGAALRVVFTTKARRKSKKLKIKSKKE
jgi:hypothetical protein